MDEIPSVNVELSEEELWLVRSAVRHEMAQMDTWKTPPANRELNHEIALLIAAGGPGILSLTESDCRVLDYCVPQDAKDKDGRLIGKNLLMKVCCARRELAFQEIDPDHAVSAFEPPTESKAEVIELLKDWTN